jgi:transposase InsO family protein
LETHSDRQHGAVVWPPSRKTADAAHAFGADPLPDRVMQSMIPRGDQEPKTSQKNPAHKIYPYLLKDLAITRPNQVWCTDITYIKMQRGFLYLVAIMDWHSRKVLSWRLSNSSA